MPISNDINIKSQLQLASDDLGRSHYLLIHSLELNTFSFKNTMEAVKRLKSVTDTLEELLKSCKKS